jgi:signal peptidase I
MANEQLSMHMAMATAPALPGPGVTVSQPLFTSFTIIRLLQKTVLVLVMATMSMGSYWIATNFVVKSVKVVGKSMVPTLKENNRYLLNIWALHNREPRRNDIVVIRDPGDHGLSVKRIVAVGGESVLFKSGKVYVNGHALNEPYLLPNVRTFTYSAAKEQLINVGKDEYFVLGDNRLVSIDSRSYGPVSREDVLGLVKPN